MLLFTQAAHFLLGTVSAASQYARGWGNHIKWVNLQEGQKLVRDTGKPAMIVIHKTWCPACTGLRSRFAAHNAIGKLSNGFIMINVQDDEEPKSHDYKPDGGYIPRILFMSPTGEVMSNVQNPTDAKNKYFYSDPSTIADTMRRVLNQHDIQTPVLQSNKDVGPPTVKKLSKASPASPATKTSRSPRRVSRTRGKDSARSKSITRAGAKKDRSPPGKRPATKRWSAPRAEQPSPAYGNYSSRWSSSGRGDM